MRGVIVLDTSFVGWLDRLESACARQDLSREDGGWAALHHIMNAGYDIIIPESVLHEQFNYTNHVVGLSRRHTGEFKLPHREMRRSKFGLMEWVMHAEDTNRLSICRDMADYEALLEHDDAHSTGTTVIAYGDTGFGKVRPAYEPKAGIADAQIESMLHGPESSTALPHTLLLTHDNGLRKSLGSKGQHVGSYKHFLTMARELGFEGADTLRNIANRNQYQLGVGEGFDQLLGKLYRNEKPRLDRLLNAPHWETQVAMSRSNTDTERGV